MALPPPEQPPVKVESAIQLPKSKLLSDPEFARVLAKVSVDHTVVIAMGNEGFIPMLTNFIVTSIQRWNIANFLAVALTPGMCKKLPAGTTCFEMQDPSKGGSFGTAGFARLVNVKTEVIMAAVSLGYNSLLVDGDIVFLKNPMPQLMAGLNKYDIQIQVRQARPRHCSCTFLACSAAHLCVLVVLGQDDDKGGRNSGFMMCKASPWSLGFLGRALHIALQAKNMRQQPAVNQALKEMKSKPLKVHVLPTNEYPCGMMYFEKPKRRMFYDEHPCEQCVIMHNNWIVGGGAKVYRFKEHLQWFVDTNNYYTSKKGVLRCERQALYRH